MVAPVAAGVYYVVVTIAGTATRQLIKVKGKEAAQKLATQIGGKVYKDGTKRVVEMLRHAKKKTKDWGKFNVETTKNSKVIKDLIKKKQSITQKVKDKTKTLKETITSVFKRKKPKPKVVEKKEPKVEVKKTSTKTDGGGPKLRTQKESAELTRLLKKQKELAAKLKKAKTKAEKDKINKQLMPIAKKIHKINPNQFKPKPKKGDTIFQKGKKMVWTGTKWTAWTVGVAAALKAGEKILGSMKTDADNTQIRWQLDGVVYKNYEDYNKALKKKKKEEKNKTEVKKDDKKTEVKKDKSTKTKVINTKGGQKVLPKSGSSKNLKTKTVDRVIKKEDVKTVDNKKAISNNNKGTAKGTSWKDYKTISAAQRAGSPFFNRDGVKKAAVTAEQLTKSGLTLNRYMNIKLGKTARKK
tara:strand:+ start:918 stop:2150 length:1233 start_codon:yes stop_codon:yes gene_type:complete